MTQHFEPASVGFSSNFPVLFRPISGVPRAGHFNLMPNPMGWSGLSVSLVGAFRMETPQGLVIELAGELPKRLIAILLRSPNNARSRDQLVDLMWDGPKDGYASLRQLRHHLHRRLSPHGAGLSVSGNVVSLTGVTETQHAGPVGQAEFFDDAGFGSEAFEDWLRTERLAESAQPTAPLRTILQKRSAPHLGLGIPITTGPDQRSAAVGDLMATALREAVLANDFAILSDLRQMQGRPAEVDCLIEVRVTQVGEMAEVTVAALLGAGLRCIFTHRLCTRSDGNVSTDRPDVAAFISTSVAGIERALARNMRFDLMAWNEAPLYEIVTRMFRMNRDDVLAATQALESFESDLNQASVLAWRAFGKMLLNGEHLVAKGSPHVDEARALMVHAMEADPANPTALAVNAHFASFIDRDFQRSADLSDASLRIAPHSPFANDVRSMLELYSGHLETAAMQARLATALAQNGPLRHYVEGSVVMTAALAGDHDTALRRGREILLARPNFLPVMRHMFASLALTGQIDAARHMLDRIRRMDPVFGTPAMEEPSYSLPSRESRLLVNRAMRAIDMKSQRGGVK